MSIFDPVYRQNNLGGEITRTLFVIGQAFKNLLWDRSKIEHLTPTQIKTLLFIKFTRKDAITNGNLAKYLSCTPATTSGIVDSLENKDLILRSRDSSDRRRVHISLTPGGNRLIGVVDNIGDEVEEVISEFNHDEQIVLQKLLLKISDRLVDKGIILLGDICTKCSFFKQDMYIGELKPHYCEHLHIGLSEDDICKECPHYKQH